MKKLSVKLLEAAMFVSLVVGCVVSASQVTAKAQIIEEETPVCHGLTCWDVSDCGSKCFCNRPSSTCYSDQEVEQ